MQTPTPYPLYASCGAPEPNLSYWDQPKKGQICLSGGYLTGGYTVVGIQNGCGILNSVQKTKTKAIFQIQPNNLAIIYEHNLRLYY